MAGGSLPTAPASSPLQRKAAEGGKYPPVPEVCVVTGGTGFVSGTCYWVIFEHNTLLLTHITHLLIHNTPT